MGGFELRQAYSKELTCRLVMGSKAFLRRLLISQNQLMFVNPKWLVINKVAAILFLSRTKKPPVDRVLLD
ncbi:hypothetical protein D3C73_1627450 [compost metagenome]